MNRVRANLCVSSLMCDYVCSLHTLSILMISITRDTIASKL